MFSRTAIHAGVSTHMYGNSTRFSRKYHKYARTHPNPSLHCSARSRSFESPRLSVRDHMRRRQATLFYSIHTPLWPIDFNQARLPVTPFLQKKRLYYYCFSPKLTLAAASTNLDIRLVRNEYLISSPKPNSSRWEHINAHRQSIFIPSIL